MARYQFVRSIAAFWASVASSGTRYSPGGSGSPVPGSTTPSVAPSVVPPVSPSPVSTGAPGTNTADQVPVALQQLSGSRVQVPVTSVSETNSPVIATSPMLPSNVRSLRLISPSACTTASPFVQPSPAQVIPDRTKPESVLPWSSKLIRSPSQAPSSGPVEPRPSSAPLQAIVARVKIAAVVVKPRIIRGTTLPRPSA